MRYLKSYQKFEAVSAPEPTEKELEKILAKIAKEENLDPEKVITGAQNIAKESTKESPVVNEEIIAFATGALIMGGVVALLVAGIKGVVRKEFNDYAKRRADEQITLLEKEPGFVGDREKLIKAAYQKLKADPEFEKKYEEEQAKYSGKGGASRQVGG